MRVVRNRLLVQRQRNSNKGEQQPNLDGLKSRMDLSHSGNSHRFERDSNIALADTIFTAIGVLQELAYDASYEIDEESTFGLGTRRTIGI